MRLKEQFDLITSKPEDAKLLRKLNSKLAQEVYLLRGPLNPLKTCQSDETAKMEAESLASVASLLRPSFADQP